MKLSREKLRRMILLEISRRINENDARNEASAKEFLEKRKRENLTDDERRTMKSDYKIAKIEDVKKDDKVVQKRFFFMSDPVVVDVTADPEKEES